ARDRDEQALRVVPRSGGARRARARAAGPGVRRHPLGRHFLGRGPAAGDDVGRRPAGAVHPQLAGGARVARLAAGRGGEGCLRRRPDGGPSRTSVHGRESRARVQPSDHRVASGRHARPHPRAGGRQPVLRRRGDPYADRPRRDRARRRSVGRDRPRRRGRDPRHAARIAPRPHRPPAAREQEDASRRVGHRPAVRRHCARARAGAEAVMSARAELGTLEASGLIQIAALQPELEYLFRHALVQEAAYASLLKQDRRTLHLAAAEAIIELHPERRREHAAVIAMHLEQAGEAARAAQQFIVAGEHALEQAIAGAAGADPLNVTEVYFWIAFLRRQRGETAESSSELRQALERGAEISRTLTDPTAAALPRALMGAFVAFMGGLRQGARDMSEALDQIEVKGDPVSIAMVSDFLAMTYSRLGEFELAQETIERAARYAGDGDAIARVDVDISRSALALERGEVDRAHAQARDCSERAES